jgi:hypothetical protein
MSFPVQHHDHVARFADHDCWIVTARVPTQAWMLFRQRDVDIVVVTPERVEVGGLSAVAG